MNETDEARPRNFFSLLGDIFFAPKDAFRNVAAHPRWQAPFAVLLLLSLAFTAVWMGRVDPQQFSKNQLAESGVLDRIPPEKHAEVVEQQASLVKVMGWVSPFVFVPLTYLIVSAVFLFVFRFVFGGEVTWRQSLAVVCWSFLAVGLVTTPLLLLVLHLKNDWNLDPRFVLQASPAALVERGTLAKPLYTLLGALDLFSVWTVMLLSAGYAAALRRPFSAGAVGVVGAWAVYVLVNVGLAALI